MAVMRASKSTGTEQRSAQSMHKKRIRRRALMRRQRWAYVGRLAFAVCMQGTLLSLRSVPEGHAGMNIHVLSYQVIERRQKIVHGDSRSQEVTRTTLLVLFSTSTRQKFDGSICASRRVSKVSLHCIYTVALKKCSPIALWAA